MQLISLGSLVFFGSSLNQDIHVVPYGTFQVVKSWKWGDARQFLESTTWRANCWEMTGEDALLQLHHTLMEVVDISVSLWNFWGLEKVEEKISMKFLHHVWSGMDSKPVSLQIYLAQGRCLWICKQNLKPIKCRLTRLCRSGCCESVGFLGDFWALGWELWLSTTKFH